MKIGIVQTIDSGHHLPGHPTCGQPHGHTYRIELSLEGPLVNGMVMDFADAKRHLQTVIGKLDHVDLNEVIAYPTCENICTHIATALRAKISLPFILRVWEGDGKWAETDSRDA